MRPPLAAAVIVLVAGCGPPAAPPAGPRQSSAAAFAAGRWVDLTHAFDLSTLPPAGAFVAALPMKIAGGSGGPLRIVARLPDQDR